MDILDQSEAIRGYAATLDLGNGRILDCYELPSGEKRVGFAGASQALGHEKNWLGRLPKQGTKLLKVLQATGYTGLPVPVSANVRGTEVRAKTISIRDFTKLIAQEAIVNKNTDAIILMGAFLETGIEKVVNDLFSGRNVDYLLQKIVHYSQWTHEELEEVLLYNREEARSLHLSPR